MVIMVVIMFMFIQSDKISVFMMESVLVGREKPFKTMLSYRNFRFQPCHSTAGRGGGERGAGPAGSATI